MTVKGLTDQFSAAGIVDARLDARLLVGHVLGLSPGETALYGDRLITEDAAGVLAGLAARRSMREPVGRLLGQREFWGLTFTLVPDTLEPRPDSETLVSAVLEHHRHKSRILDLGTGTGCLLIAVLSEWRDATGLGIDISAAAVACATGNAARAGVGERAAFRVSDWFQEVEGRFDIVVANPPYLSSADMTALQPEVRHDPVAALVGGADGLAAYRAILAGVGTHLVPGGRIVFEVGATQADAVGTLAAGAGFSVSAVRCDLGGHARCLILSV